MEERIEYLEEKLKELAEILVEVTEGVSNKSNLTTQIIKKMQTILVDTEDKIKEIKTENKSFGERIQKLEKKLEFISRQN